jgi:hypothetical protein
MKSADTAVMELGPLAFLSIQHTERGKFPQAPSNEERMRAFRHAQPIFHANNYEWRFRSSVLQSVS